MNESIHPFTLNNERQVFKGNFATSWMWQFGIISADFSKLLLRRKVDALSLETE